MYLESQAQINEWFESWLCGTHINVVVGSVGSGKTGTIMYCAEQAHLRFGRHVAIMNCPVPGDLPDFISSYDDFSAVPNGSILIIDDAILFFYSRGFMSKESRVLSSLLALSRQKDLLVMFSVQNLALLDINTFRMGNIYLWFRAKYSSFSLLFEREDISSFVSDIYSALSDLNFPKISLCCVVGEDVISFLETPLPTFWSDKISKIWSDIRIKND